MDFCPFCNKTVAPAAPDRIVINNSGTVCHSSCFEEAKQNAEASNHARQSMSSVQHSGKRLDDGLRKDRRNQWPGRS